MGSTLSELTTGQLRKSFKPELWASLDVDNLELGDYGYVDKTGSFTKLGNQQFISSVGPLTAVGDYSLQNQYSSEHQVPISGGVTFIDPEGTEVKGGVQVNWSFSKSATVTSVMTSAYSLAYNNLLEPLSEAGAVESLWSAAKEASWITGSGSIRTGFCVVVSLLRIYAGVVVASESSSAEFSIQGSVEGVQDLLAGNATGCYTSVENQSAVMQFTWPSAGTAQLGKKIQNPLRTFGVMLATFDDHNNPILYT